MPKEQIFHKSVLTRSQADAIMSALKSIHPDFVPQVPEMPSSTHIPEIRLLEKLKEPQVEKVDMNLSLSDLDVDKISSMFEKQLENEMRGTFVWIEAMLI